MRQRQIRRTEPPIGAQHRELAIDLPPALDADQRRDPACRVNPPDVGSGDGGLEHARIAREDLLHQPDLIERRFDLFRPRQTGRHIDRPELPADLALTQPRNVGVELGRVQPVEIDRPARIARRID